MTFLHPLALLGLAAAAIPVLLHLFRRRTPPELEFPAVRYLAEAERRTARRLRLRHLVLLLLRTALIALVVIAAARPLVPARDMGSTHAPTALVVILDNSASAGATGGGRLALDRLRVAARASLAAATPDDRVFLVLADGVVRTGDRAELLAAADAAVAEPVRLDVVDAVGRAARVVAAEPLAEREVHVVSDLQASAIADGRAEVPDGVRMLALEPGGTMANRGVAAAEVRDGAVAAAVGGTPGAGSGPVTLVVGGRDVARALAAPGEEVVLAVPALAPGWWTGEVRVAPDELRVDDVRPVAWRVAPAPPVAVGPAAGPFVTEALAVLRDAGRVTAGSAVRVGADPAPGAVVLPPADAALVGAANRALATSGAGWRFGAAGTPGLLVARDSALGVAGIAVARRLRLEGTGGEVLATVNGEPWLVADAGQLLLGSRLDTAWTALPTSPAFVPFVERLVRRAAHGERGARVVVGASAVRFDVRGADTVGVTIAALDPRESDLTAATPAQVRRALGVAPLGDAAFAAARFGGARRADASAVLLVLALLLAAGEVIVAWRTR